MFLELILHAPRFSFASLTNSPRNRLWRHQVLTIQDTSSSTWLKGKRTFRQYQSSLDENLFLLLSSDPTMLKTLPKTFQTEMKFQWSKKGEERAEKAQPLYKSNEGSGDKIEAQSACPDILRMPELRKLIFGWTFCMWKRRPQSARPKNGVGGTVLAFHSQMVTKKVPIALKGVFRKNSQGRMTEY